MLATPRIVAAGRSRLAIYLATCSLALAGLLPASPSHAVENAPLRFVMQSFPPFAYEQQGEIRGPFPELLLAVCSMMKVRCQLAIYPWRRALRLAESGAADGILVIQRLEERERHFYLTEPVMRSSYGIYVNQASDLHGLSAAQLARYTVGAYGPSATSRAAAEVLQPAPTADLVMEIDNLTALKKLAAHRYGDKGAAVVNIDVANYLIKHDGLTQLRLAAEVRQIEYLIGLSKRGMSAAQAQQFRAALHRLMEDGTVQAIAEKYEVRAARPLPAATQN